MYLGLFGINVNVFGADPAERAITELRRAEGEYERPEGLGPLEVSVTPDPRKPWEAKAFADLGVTRLIVTPPRAAGDDVGELVRFVETISSSE
jgi:hypothetical protein